MLTPEKSGAQLSTSAQMTFHRTMTTTMGPMQDSLPKNVKIVLTATSDRWFYDKERMCINQYIEEKKIPKILAGLKLMNSAGSQPSSPLLQNQDQGMLQQS
ncbi:uncharacterized protein LOC144010842 [Festucalex cinctus]